MKPTTMGVVLGFFLAAGVLVFQWVKQQAPAPQVMHRVDTVRVETTVHDTVTVVTRATDTVRVTIKDVGPLTEQDLVRLVCGRLGTEYENTERYKLHGDKRDAFVFNGYGMVMCPTADDK